MAPTVAKAAMWLWIGCLIAPLAAQKSAADFSDPSIAPDRPEIAFVSGGDIWTAPLGGGEAHLLVSHPATESRPLYSPDGSRLAFVSDRTGNGDIYVLTLATGTLKRITFDDANDALDAWSRDGKYLYFSSTSQDIAGMAYIFRVNAEGGTPMPVSADRYVAEYFAAPSPAGDMLALTARGVTWSQWWRHGHSHLDESEIWLETLSGAPKYQLLHGGDFKSLWPMWSADGARVYFVSDQGGAENIWEKPVRGGAARQVTKFKDGRVLFPNISYDGKTIVFERDFRIWKLDAAAGAAAPVEIALRGAAAGPDTTHLSLTNQFHELALSPDGRKMAFAAHGEIFAASARDGGQAARLTHTPAAESQAAWSPDSRRVVYVSSRDGGYRLYLYDFATEAETALPREAAGDSAPGWSPDGKLISFLRGDSELCVYDLASREARTVAKGRFGRLPFSSRRAYAWSPDSRWIAYASSGERGFRNIFIAPVSAGEPRQVTFLSNSGGGAVLWSPDGTYLLFDTSQRTEDNAIARLDLLAKTPPFREDRFRDLFKESTRRGETHSESAERPPVKPVEIVFEGIRNRLTFLPLGLDARLHAISADGKLLLIGAEAARQQNLYTYSLDELAQEPPVARQITATLEAKSNAQFSPDGKEVYYLEQGRVNVTALDTRQARVISTTAELDVDFNREKSEVFAEAWTYLNNNFYDPAFHGADWKALRERFAPRVEAARTPDELRRVISLMLGELNSSHLGISAPLPSGQNGPAAIVGKLGLRFDAVEYEKSGHLRIAEVIPQGPAALSGEIKPGQYLLAIDGVSARAPANLDELLDHRVNRRVALTLAGQADGADRRQVAVRPISMTAEKDLVYRQWVEAQRAYVAKASGGRLGYVHIRDMSAGALDRLYRDLDSENQAREGVVVDVRNNSGGFVNVYAIDVLSRRSYLRMTDRGQPEAPARIVLGQRALERPTILVVNRDSLSDAEDFTEGYRALKLGKVVGEPTAGWIIYTCSVTLIDGSRLRVPQTRVATADGVTMEGNPRPVDVAVDKPLGESYLARDSQLDAAVRELLRDLDAHPAAGRK